MPQHAIVVKRGDFQRFDALYKTFSARVPVIWDRRRQEIHAAHVSGRPDGQPDRRHPSPPSWVALGFVVVEHEAKSPAPGRSST
jgi:hypothetical protein